MIIMGDFNYDLLKGNTNFLQYMEETFTCKQIVSKVTTDYGSLIDLVFCKTVQARHIETDVLEAYWSDHKIVYVAIDMN